MSHCSHCGAERPDVVGLNIDGEEFGFDTIACFVLWTRARYMEVAA